MDTFSAIPGRCVGAMRLPGEGHLTHGQEPVAGRGMFRLGGKVSRVGAVRTRCGVFERGKSNHGCG
jgi:hypothetical protein